MKKVIIIITTAVVLFALLLINIMITPLMNNLGAKKEMDRIKDTPLPDRSELVETFYLAGNLNGSGNKMNFYGAVVIRSELSLEEIDKHYSAYRKGKYDMLVQHQASQQLEDIERNYGFDDTVDADVSDGKYYLVYTWGNGIAPYNHLVDLRAN
ncbi:hypothetical protein [Butyrivibrio sp. MC2021]|uniref:hypothetical protein n=1 Tax=Butyrivibrio sp. MC2021 TaxID=1408306 RepID=UPI00047A9168|nr:hypothetical protein [Butyrivibrio sp. MC2021]